jgi:hypothetical protein
MTDQTNQPFMKYAIKRHDGKLFPERYTTYQAARQDLEFKLGNGATEGLAWIVKLIA